MQPEGTWIEGPSDRGRKPLEMLQGFLHQKHTIRHSISVDGQSFNSYQPEQQILAL